MPEELPDKRAGYIYSEVGERVSLYVEPAVKRSLESFAREQRRSVSWMANSMLKQAMGIPDDAMVPKGHA